MTRLDIPVLMIQIVLPLTLLVWLAVAPSRHTFGLVVQIASTLLAFMTLALIPIWLIPPWWTPYAYGAILALMLLIRFTRGGTNFLSVMPRRWTAWIALLPFSLLGGFAVMLSLDALAGRQPSDLETIDLPLPLGTGRYLVANGGSRESVNGHLLTLDPKTERQRAYRGQSLAIDLVEINGLGLRADGWRPRDPARYLIFGRPVTAPCTGEIISARNDMPDRPVPEPDRSHLEGNHVLIDCGDFTILLAHLREGSVKVSASHHVSVGDLLGEVGNSGQTFEPHLHIHAQKAGPPEAPFSGEPLQLTLDGRFPIRNDRIREDAED